MSEKQGNNNGKVGKNRPPVKSSWKPGQSGNPKGRPKKDVSLTSLLKKYLDEVPSVKIGDKINTEQTWRELIVQAWLVGSYKGNSTLFKELLERVEGKVAQPLVGKDDKDLIPEGFNILYPVGTVIKEGRMSGEVPANGNGHKETKS